MSGGSFLHQKHRWIGREVEDTVTGRRRGRGRPRPWWAWWQTWLLAGALAGALVSLVLVAVRPL
ncbi:hypothetical protein ACWEPA_17465 [Streptomyces filamentosus]